MDELELENEMNELLEGEDQLALIKFVARQNNSLVKKVTGINGKVQKHDKSIVRLYIMIAAIAGSGGYSISQVI